MRDFETALTVSRLKDILQYCPDTGVFRFKVRRGRIPAGSIAGTYHRGGYVIIRIDYFLYRAHRLAWLYMTGGWPKRIDHKDLNKHNNRWSNLREATSSENLANQAAPKTNTSGYKGVTWHRQRRRWQAGIQVNGRHKHLGLFADPEEAHSAYVVAAQKYFGQFARAS